MGYSDFKGRINIGTARVTDVATGKEYEYYDWVDYKQNTLQKEHQDLCDNRQVDSDLTNAPGTKEDGFKDDWFGVEQELVRPPAIDPPYTGTWSGKVKDGRGGISPPT